MVQAVAASSGVQSFPSVGGAAFQGISLPSLSNDGNPEEELVAVAACAVAVVRDTGSALLRVAAQCCRVIMPFCLLLLASILADP